MDPMSVAFALVFAALITAVAALGLTRPPRGRHRRPFAPALATTVEGLPLALGVTGAAVAVGAAAGLVVVGPAARLSAMLGDVMALLVGWAL
jgi:hypothetical protein